MSLSKLRQCFLPLLQSGLALTLLAAHSVIADQDGNSLPYRECFESTAKNYNLDRDWLTAIAIVESSLNPKAVSSANAVGLMQIKWPQTAAHLGVRTRRALFDPCTNVDAGGRYLRELTDRYDGDMQTALAAYRIGPSALARAPTEPEVVLEYRRRIDEQLDILRPAKSSSYPNNSIVVEAPAPRIEPTPEETPAATPATARTVELATAPSPNKQDAATPVAKPVNVETTAVSRKLKATAAAPHCDIRELQLQSLSTHHPAKREQRFFDWLEANGSACSTSGLIKVKNQMTVWLGTAAGSKRIVSTLDAMLNTP